MPTKSKESRFKSLDDPQLPDVLGAEYLIAYLNELGLSRSHSGGVSAIDYQEIESWSRLVSLDLSPWEASSLYTLSAHYADQLNQSFEPSTIAPYSPIIEPENYRDQIDDFFRRLPTVKG